MVVLGVLTVGDGGARRGSTEGEAMQPPVTERVLTLGAGTAADENLLAERGERVASQLLPLLLMHIVPEVRKVERRAGRRDTGGGDEDGDGRRGTLESGADGDGRGTESQYLRPRQKDSQGWHANLGSVARLSTEL